MSVAFDPNNNIVLKQASILQGVSENNSVVNEYSLSQNYPNPFNPVTVIKYQIPVSDNVRLNVYDLNGKKFPLVNEKQNSGFYEVQFDGSKYSSGVYYYMLKKGNFIETRSMILVK